MNAKEKAKELYDKFRNENPVMSANIRSKKQAIIAVDEILKITCLKNLDYEKYSNNNSEFKTFWQDVKKELELLK